MEPTGIRLATHHAAGAHALVPVGAGYDHAQAKKLFRNLLDVSATVAIEPERVTVTFDKRADNPFLVQSRLADAPTPMPWFGKKTLHLQIS